MSEPCKPAPTAASSDARQTPETAPAPASDLDQLRTMSRAELLIAMREAGIALPDPSTLDLEQPTEARAEDDIRSMRLQLMNAQGRAGQSLGASGTVQVLAEGYAFLRHAAHAFLPGADDIHVSPNQVRALRLRNGSVVRGAVRLPRPGERFLGLEQVWTVDGLNLDAHFAKTPFAELEPICPHRVLPTALPGDAELTRADQLAPVCAGQRVLLRSPSSPWGSSWLARWAQALLTNHADVSVLFAALEAPPERVAALRDACEAWPNRAMWIAPPLGTGASAATNRPGADQLAAITLATNQARRQLEAGRHAVLIVDSANSLSRSWSMAMPPTGRVLAPGFDAGAMRAVLETFAAARTVKEGGSLTIVCVADCRDAESADRLIHERLHDLAQVVVTLSAQNQASTENGEDPPPYRIDWAQTFTRPEADVRSATERNAARAAHDSSV